MTPFEPLVMMLDTLERRHGLPPPAAWEMVVRAARRKQVSVVDLCRSALDPERPDGPVEPDRASGRERASW